MVAANVTYDGTKKVIRVEVLGAETIQDWETSKTQVLQLSVENDCHRVLVDARKQLNAPNTFELFQFVEAWPTSIRVAKVVGEKSRADQHFAETVAINRGIPMKDFDDECEAMEWLIEK